MSRDFSSRVFNSCDRSQGFYNCPLKSRGKDDKEKNRCFLKILFYKTCSIALVTKNAEPARWNQQWTKQVFITHKQWFCVHGINTKSFHQPCWGFCGSPSKLPLFLLFHSRGFTSPAIIPSDLLTWPSHFPWLIFVFMTINGCDRNQQGAVLPPPSPAPMELSTELWLGNINSPKEHGNVCSDWWSGRFYCHDYHLALLFLAPVLAFSACHISRGFAETEVIFWRGTWKFPCGKK